MVIEVGADTAPDPPTDGPEAKKADAGVPLFPAPDPITDGPEAKKADARLHKALIKAGILQDDGARRGIEKSRQLLLRVHTVVMAEVANKRVARANARTASARARTVSANARTAAAQGQDAAGPAAPAKTVSDRKTRSERRRKRASVTGTRSRKRAKTRRSTSIWKNHLDRLGALMKVVGFGNLELAEKVLLAAGGHVENAIRMFPAAAAAEALAKMKQN